MPKSYTEQIEPNSNPVHKVLVTDPLNEEGLTILKDVAEIIYEPGMSQEQICSIIPECSGLLVRSGTQVNAEIIAACSTKMQIIGRAGVGVDNIDVEAATKKGIIVVNSPDGNTTAAAEHTIAMILGLVRHLAPADLSMKTGKWNRKDYIGVELRGKWLGIVGLGKIGGKVAEIAKAIGMKICAYDPIASPERAAELGARMVSLDELLSMSDLITLHVPKTPQTTNLIDAAAFSKMKTTARIINCSRGGIIDQNDLVEAIKSKRIAGAALDVFDEEPLTSDSELRQLQDAVLLTPHLGASTAEAQLNVAIDVSEQIRQVLQGGFATNAVNLPGLRGASELAEHLGLAAMLGEVAGQLSSTSRPLEMSIKVMGKLCDKDLYPLTLAALQGMLSEHLEGITFVNAPAVAKERQIRLKEIKQPNQNDHGNTEVLIELKTDRYDFEVGGALMEGSMMITRLNGFSFLLSPTANMLITLHNDCPGVIAKIAKLLGDADVNISGMALGRKTNRSEALMVCSIDEAIPGCELAKIKAIPEIVKATVLTLQGLN